MYYHNLTATFCRTTKFAKKKVEKIAKKSLTKGQKSGNIKKLSRTAGSLKIEQSKQNKPK